MNEKNTADGKQNSYKISGMHCAMCVKSVENALKKVNGVSQVEVNLGTETAYVNSSGLSDVSSIKNAIEDAGYGLIMDEITLNIQGMHCAMCVKSIEQALTALDGVFSVDIDLTAETARIKYLSESITISEIKGAVAKAGYKVSGISGETDPVQERMEKRTLQKKLILSVIGIITGVALMVLMYSGIHIFPLLQFVITLPLLIILGGPIFKAAYLSLANRALTMDVMYSMGMGVALISSFLAMLNVLPQRGFLFFDTVLMLSSFLTLGRYLEEKAKGGTGAAIRKLMQLSPSEVLVIKDGVEMRIAAVELVPGDIVLCRHGEKVPTDGEIIEGKAYVDESMLTGESISVKKSVGDKAIGGTLNTNGFIKIRVNKVGAETVLSQIIRVVQEAQLSKPQLQKLADNVVSYFIPVVFIIAVLTFLIWKFMIGSPLDMALTRLISVLVVACPCALGLATPTAVTTGIGRGAQLGILIKNGDALENSARIDVAVFDKTGTLTLGEPRITSLMTLKGDADKIKLKAGSLERYASHPFASTISGEFLISGEEPLDAKDIRVLEGKGISGSFANQVFMIGSFEYYSEYESPSEELVSKVDHVIDLDETPVLCWDTDSLMLMGISDPIKPDASKAVGELQQMGLDVFMITGDIESSAKAIAKQAGISKVLSSVKPAAKAHEIEKLKGIGKKVLFVGDGINDAPALATADLGIAMGGGTDIAMESGNIVTMQSDVASIPAALQLASRVYKQIKMNLFWAFIYNIVLIPVAAGALSFWIDFRPEFAGGAMAMSSVTVVMLSLQLRKFTPDILKKKEK